MAWYWRFKRLFAIYIEFSKDIGSHPFINMQHINNELMIEIPYGYVIITPRHILLNEHAAYTTRIHEMSKHEKRDRRLFRYLTGTPKN